MKSQGYPDIEFIDKNNQLHYLECKTFNKNNIDTTQRSFYLSRSEDFKIAKDDHHFLISFEIFVFKKSENYNIYKTSTWKILSLEYLNVDIKYEFNANNQSLYKKDNILAEGFLTKQT